MNLSAEATTDFQGMTLIVGTCKIVIHFPFFLPLFVGREEGEGLLCVCGVIAVSCIITAYM